MYEPLKHKTFSHVDYEHIARIFPTPNTDHIIVASLIIIRNIYLHLYITFFLNYLALKI